MSAAVSSHRDDLLRVRREKLSGIVTARKRKLREFFAVTTTDVLCPVPILGEGDGDGDGDALEEERVFLEVGDVLKDRQFDIANLPPRRFLRSDTSKKASLQRGQSPDVVKDVSRKAAKIQRDGSRRRGSRATTPASRSENGDGRDNVVDTNGYSMQRSTSKGSQTDQVKDSAVVLDEIVEESFENAGRPRDGLRDQDVPDSALEIERVQQLASAPNSPGVDPREAMPISAEDAAELDEPLVEGLGSHDGPPHKALTAHLPPKEVQERRLRDTEARECKDLEIHLPPRDGGRAEPLSSPGSTVGAHSATTPALHEASTDTSPDNEARYDVDRMDQDDEPETPPELKKTPEEEAEKEEHDRIHQAQVDLAREKILGSSPAAVDTLEEQEQVDVHAEEGMDVSEKGDTLTKEASEVVQDTAEDEDEVVGVPTPEGDAMTGVEESSADPQPTKQPEVPDSEAETPPDRMEVDEPTVQDSFESSAPIESREEISPNAVEKPQTELKNQSATPTSSTPRRRPSTPAIAPPTLERMQTRVQSGAIQRRDTLEILGQTSASQQNITKGHDSESASHSPSGTSTPQSPGRRTLEKAKERERSKLSKVIFPKPSRPAPNDTALMPSGSQQSRELKEDYFMPLFLATSVQERRTHASLDNLTQTAHKVLTTRDAYAPINEIQTIKVLKRIYALQANGSWSLRQPERSAEPQRPSSHWDVLLGEAKWMRTDFREERKWKMAVARNLAFACAEWHESSPEDRKSLQVKATPPPFVSKAKAKDVGAKDVEMSEEDPRATPDLVSSAEFDSPTEDFDEEPRLNLLETVAPTAIFGLQDDDVVFGLRRSPTADKLLEELPMYGPPLSIPQVGPSKALDPDRFWKRPALPLSKYVEGRMELKKIKPPNKRSRFQYEEEDDDDDQVVFGEPVAKTILPPEYTHVALFNPEYENIRLRIHAGHQFRPPSEHQMPSQSFYENRAPSQWTYAEDDQLKSLVRDYSYNWSLISSIVTPKSKFTSGAERRTPWECFERWISLEGLPADMQKTHYFRLYNARVEAANRVVMAQAQAAPQPNAQGQLQPPRRRTTQSVRVERRRNQKHLTLVDAMRKLAKKRETNIQKQNHAAGLAAMRKANEQPNPRNPARTPQDFSKIKYEQQERMKEQMAIFQQRQEAQRRAAIQARQLQGQPGQPLPNGAPPQRPTSNGAPNGNPTSGPNLSVPGQNRARGPMPPQMAAQVPMQNGGIRVPQPLLNGVPQAPMQTMQGQLPLPNPSLDVGLVTQAHRISEQQRQAIQMRQQQLPGVHNSPPRNMNGMSPQGFPQMQPNMMPFPNTNGNVSSPGAGPSPVGQAGSPRMNNPQQLMVPQVNRLEQQIREKYPTATNDQVMRLLSDHLARSVNQRQGLAQSAMNAAAGASGMNGMANGVRMPAGAENSPQLYAQMLRQQQENQAKAAQAQAQANGNGSNGSNGNGSAGGHQRNGSSGSGK